MKVHGKINESMEKLSWKQILIFSSLLAVLRFLACCDLKWSLRLALSYARLAVCSLRILRTAQTSLLKAISQFLMAYCLLFQSFNILTLMAESLTTRSVNSHWIQNWSRTRSESSTFGSARWWLAPRSMHNSGCLPFSWLRYFGICNCFGNISSLRFFAVHLSHGVVSSWCTWFVPSAGWYFGSYWSSLQCIVKRSTIIARRTSIATKAVGVGSYFVEVRQHGWTLGMDTITRGLIRNHARDTFSSTGCRWVSYCARVEPSPQLASSDRWKTCSSEQLLKCMVFIAIFGIW